MDIKKVLSVYFTGTGTTKKIVSAMSQEAARLLHTEVEDIDFSLPTARKSPLVFSKNELVIFGLFVVAGRVPNVLLPFLNTIQGNEAIAIPVVLYGNRSYDDALIELKDILNTRELHTPAAAAFIGEHSFSETLAKGRPDIKDIAIAKEFAKKITEKLQASSQEPQSIQVPGTTFPYRNYYQPLNIDKKPVNFLKITPTTSDCCINCKLCADICPMGAIDRMNVENVTGTCIKCCACIKKCPTQAKHFVNKDFLSHKVLLETTYTKHNEPELFI